MDNDYIEKLLESDLNSIDETEDYDLDLDNYELLNDSEKETNITEISTNDNEWNNFLDSSHNFLFNSKKYFEFEESSNNQQTLTDDYDNDSYPTIKLKIDPCLLVNDNIEENSDLNIEEKQIIVDILDLIVNSIENIHTLSVPRQSDSDRFEVVGVMNYIVSKVCNDLIFENNEETESNERIETLDPEQSPEIETQIAFTELLNEYWDKEKSDHKIKNSQSNTFDELMIWNEERAFESLLEKEKQARLERKKKREFAMEEAKKEKNAIKIQAIVRMFIDRKNVIELMKTNKERIKIEKLALEFERKNMEIVAEEESNRHMLERQLKREEKERKEMKNEEDLSLLVWQVRDDLLQREVSLFSQEEKISKILNQQRDSQISYSSHSKQELLVGDTKESNKKKVDAPHAPSQAPPMVNSLRKRITKKSNDSKRNENTSSLLDQFSSFSSNMFGFGGVVTRPIVDFFFEDNDGEGVSDDPHGGSKHQDHFPDIYKNILLDETMAQNNDAEEEYFYWSDGSSECYEITDTKNFSNQISSHNSYQAEFPSSENDEAESKSHQSKYCAIYPIENDLLLDWKRAANDQIQKMENFFTKKTASDIFFVTESSIEKVFPSSRTSNDEDLYSSSDPLVGSWRCWAEYYQNYILKSLENRDANQQDNKQNVVPRTESFSTQSKFSDKNDSLSLGIELHTNPSLVSELDMSVEEIQSIEFLKKYPNLNKLLLNVNKISQFDVKEFLPKLQYLSLKDNLLVDANSLRGFESLTHLFLDSNRLTDINDLAHLTSLQTLAANSNAIREFPKLFCPKLQRLELFKNRIKNIPSDAFLGLPSLIHLDIGCNLLESLDGNVISTCKLLQTLILSQNKLQAVPSPLRLPLLKSLWLGGNNLTNISEWMPGVRQGSEGEWPLFAPMLQKLFLRDNLIKHLDSKIFATLTFLYELDISFNAIESVTGLKALSECSRLHVLQIQDNPLLSNSKSNADAQETKDRYSPNFYNQQYLTEKQIYAILSSWCPSLETLCGNRVSELVSPDEKAAYHFHSLSTNSEHISGRNFDLPESHKSLLELLSSFMIAQNALSCKEKVYQKQNASDGQTDWEEKTIQLLEYQVQLLARFESSGMVRGDQHISAKERSLDLRMTNEIYLPLSNSESFASPFDALKDFKSNPILSNLVVSLQSLFRGFLVRKRLGDAVKTFRYADKELEDILCQDFDFEFEEEESFFKEIDLKNAFVYGDHIRKRSKQKSHLDSESADIKQNNWVHTHDELDASGMISEQIGLKVTMESSYEENQKNYSDRPLSSKSDLSSMTVQSTSTEQDGFATPSSKSFQSKVQSLSSQKKSRKQIQSEFAEEWGIKDPKVLAAMMKRNDRIQGLMNARENRELEKNSQYRFEKFKKTTKKESVSKVSGSFGGKPKTYRNNTKKKSLSLPAWLLGENKQEDENKR